MPPPDEKTTLTRYLQDGRDAMLFKLEGLSDYDVRRPLTPTGTNLLGLIKHLAYVEFGYFGLTFDRPVGVDLSAWDDDEINSDMYAAADETREEIIGMYHKAWEVTAGTMGELELVAVGHVPWWQPGNEVSLHQILVHNISETHRHAGHADILRETIDGTVGVQSPGDNLPEIGEEEWTAYRERLERIARDAG